MDTLILSTIGLGLMVGLAVVARLLVRVCDRLDTLIMQGSRRRTWVKEEHRT